MYGFEWLIVMTLLGLAAGAVGGYLLARQLGAGGQRLRELEEQLAAARRQYEDYRHEVVTQFSETARKFQTLNDSYTDLHRQLAKSSSILCGDVSGPLLAAPSGHQDLLTDRSREPGEPAATAETADAASAAAAADRPSEPPPAATTDAHGEPDAATDEEPPTLRERVERAARTPRAAAAQSDASMLSDIRVAEPADGRDALKRPVGVASRRDDDSDSRPEAAPTTGSKAAPTKGSEAAPTAESAAPAAEAEARSAGAGRG
ncbi:MAG TPA: DUF1043 family protein [Pseudomonadales bacterium]